MHVHELNPKKTLIVLVAFVLLLLIGFLTMKKPLINYQLDMKQSIEMLYDSNAYFHPAKLVDVLNKTEQKVVLIDLRNNFEFGQGAIPGAENISTVDLTREENIERLQEFQKQGVTVVFYGEDQLEANGPWMLFNQLGFNNVKILLGGYNFYREWQDNAMDSLMDDSYIRGVPRYDFTEVAAGSIVSDEEQNTDKSAINITRRKKPAVASGGC